MKITRLELRNFRAARGLTLNLGAPRVAIFGVNGSGKTSVRECIRWTLRGVCDGTDGKGAGAEVLAPTSTNEVSTALTLDGIGTVSRLFTEHGGTAFSVEGFTGTGATQQQALLGKLGTTPVFLDACLETDYFARLHHADGKALVLSLLNVRIPIDGKDRTLEEIEALYKQSFEERKEAKRRLTQMPVPSAPVLPEAVQVAQERTGRQDVSQAIRERIDAFRGELGGLERAVGEVVGKRQALEAERTRVEKVAQTIISGEDAEFTQEIVRLRGEIGAVTPGAPPTTTVQILRTRMEALARHAPPNGCVLDPDVPCKTPRKAFTEQVDALRKEIAEIPHGDVGAIGKVQQRIQDLESRLAERTRLRASIAAAELRLTELATELSAIPDVSQQDAELTAMKARIQKGEELLAVSQGYDKAQADYAKAKVSREELAARVEALETRVEMLGPKGVRVTALAEAMGAFESQINQYTQAWGWTVTFVVEPWGVIVNHRPVETYSRSERHRIGIAIQLVVASLSGLSFAVIDEMDMLDLENRRLLQGMIQTSPVGQILVLGTREPSAALPPPIEGWIFYRLTQASGQTVIAESSIPALTTA